MPELLLELFCEEIPARMQGRAADDLKRMVTDALVDAGLVYEGAQGFATPRRLALAVTGLPAKSPDTREERKGPRVGAPEKALEGFLRAAGLSSIDQASVESDPKKGDFYVAVIEKPGRPAEEVIAEIVPRVVRGFPWPKSMRWGPRSALPESLRWVRPLHRILCTFGASNEEPTVVAFEVDGLRSGNETEGHRFHAPEPFTVRRYDDYVEKLQRAHVVLEAEERRAIILNGAKNLAFAQGLTLIEDEALLEEVAGLVEWPVPLMGSFDAAFLAIPPEVIRATIRANQKCFVLESPSPAPSVGEGLGSGEKRTPASVRLANAFVLVSNIEARDGGQAIVAGNERVIRARLSDAKFFWDQDRKIPLEQQARKLDAVVFHEKLGTQGERIERIARLAREVARHVGADPTEAERAARLAKADLATGMVGEFPELQGVMGRYYALEQGVAPEIAEAVRDHYRPQGPSDAVPRTPVSMAVALADKLDMLVGFWGIDEKPTGSKDPYALRRAALGVIRIVLENGLRLRLAAFIAPTIRMLAEQADRRGESVFGKAAVTAEGMSASLSDSAVSSLMSELERHLDDRTRTDLLRAAPTIAESLLAFFIDRLKVHLREQGARHDLIDAVLSDAADAVLPMRRASDAAIRSKDDLTIIVRRVEALGSFLATENGANLLVGAKRALNILRAEEKKDGTVYDGPIHAELLDEPQEQALASALDRANEAVRTALGGEDFEAAMQAISELRGPVDAFFDHVTVNAESAAVRRNRLNLLNRLRLLTLQVADFSKIAG